jgi:hypothetical protein
VSDTQRNFLVIIAIAVIGGLFFSDAINSAAFSLNMLLSLIFMVLIGVAMWQWHKRNALRISAMEPTDRLILQVSGILLYANVLGGTFFPRYAYWGGIYTYGFFAVLALSILGIYVGYKKLPY